MKYIEGPVQDFGKLSLVKLTIIHLLSKRQTANIFEEANIPKSGKSSY